MTQLARIDGLPAQVASTHSIDDIQRMAKNVALAKLFPGIENEHAAFTLMMLCEAEGLHPITALRRYHIIEGKPCMSAELMLARARRFGHKTKWIEMSAERAEISPGEVDRGSLRCNAEVAENPIRDATSQRIAGGS